jgi:hypothetical protein
MNDKARHIRERFPDKNHRINLLMAKDPEFLALCEDYDVCVDALRYWAKSEEPEAESRFNEYRTLIQELEDEINQTLMAVKPQPMD